MTAASLRRDPGNALIALARKARHTPASSLVALETLGLAIALAIWVWAPSRWQLGLPCIALATFGLWGVIDKVIAAAGRRIDPLLLVILQVWKFLVAGAGAIAAGATIYLIFGKLMGIYVS